jgi:hypothetical protein
MGFNIDTIYIMEYIIAIPSYNRAKEIQLKTLKYLKECGIEDDVITVFVANEEEKNIYTTAGVRNKIVVGVLGITNQRNFIMNYFPLGQYVISMDDDIERLEEAIDGKFRPIIDLKKVFKENYQLMLEENRYIWGTYPVHNIFFIRKPIHTDLKFIIGVCYGYINRRIMLDVECEGKEDIQNSILHYLKDGGVLRINTIVAKTKFNAVGGLGIERYEANKRAAEALHLKYPTLTTIFQRKNGTHEIRLKGSFN